MEIGLSLIPYQGNQLNNVIEMARLLHINQFEIAFSEEFISLLGEDRPFSIHAHKDWFQSNYDEFCSKAVELKNFADSVNCKRIVLHPNENHAINTIYFQRVQEIFVYYTICIENTIEDMNGLIELVKQHSFYITWDCSHAAFHNHCIDEMLPYIHYIHVRGFSRTNRYVSLANSKEINIIPKRLNSAYILEYPYQNMYELLLDYKKLLAILND